MPSDLHADLRAELDANRTAFHALLDRLTDADLDHRGREPDGRPADWYVRDLLAHMVMSLEYVPREVAAARAQRALMPMPAWLYDRVIVLITRFMASTSSRASLRARYDQAHTRALACLANITPDEWTKRAKFFKAEDSIEQFFRRQARHIREHTAQI